MWPDVDPAYVPVDRDERGGPVAVADRPHVHVAAVPAARVYVLPLRVGCTLMLTVVIGPPTAGKTTYVEARRRPGDIVVDHDVIAVAVGSPDSHNHPPHVHLVALAARRAAITEALNRHRAGAVVWIIHTHLTTTGQRRYEHAGAEVIIVPFDPAVLHERVRQAGRPAELHHVIDTWQPVVDPFTTGRTSERW